MPVQRQRAHRLAVVACDRRFGEIRGGELVRRRTGQPAAAETVGETEILQARIGASRAAADQGDGLADEVRVVLAKQFGAIGDRRDRADQIMAKPSSEQLEYAQGRRY